ncbi:antitoxin [bacterium]|nr:antitoxin [bacterium]
MKKIKLSQEEKDILTSYENDEWVSVPNINEEKIKLQKIAHNTLKKDMRINIRISSKDLNDIKAKAIEEGLPYQSFITSILHKYISGKIVEKNIIYENSGKYISK